MAKLEFTADDNLLIVFQLPQTIPDGFCFGGGKPVMFQMVDWFRPANDLNEELDREMVREFVRSKVYYKPQYNYLVMCRAGETFLIDKPKRG